MSSLHPGYFVSFEGIDGAGKSTHIESFGKLLQERFPSREVVMTREPGGTPLGEQLRNLLNKFVLVRVWLKDIHQFLLVVTSSPSHWILLDQETLMS
jgi:thymidylate kinase